MGIGGLVVIGGGGHARVVAEAALAQGAPIEGFLDDDAEATLGSLAPRLGGLGLLDRTELIGHHPVIIGIGDLQTRASLLPRITGQLATIVHPTAFIAPSALIGGGVYVAPLCVVHTGARIGEHVIINSGTIVEHDCEIGANAHIAPGTVLGGNVRIGANTLIGVGSRVIPGVRIGADCVVGAGSVVLEDVPDGETAAGAPARVFER